MTRTAQSASQDVRELELDEIARDALHCIEIVANTAESLLHGHRSGKPESFATVNTWTSGAQVENLKAINESERAALTELIGQPVIARVDLADENGVVETVFITRSTPPSNTGYRIASYRSFLGSIAARDVGDDLSLRIGGSKRDVEVINRTKLKPSRTEQGWDSRDSEIDFGEGRRLTVVSLRELLSPAEEAVTVDAWDAWEQEGKEANVLEGIRRAVLSKMELRDQPILDRNQDEIFRLPIDSRCFLSGPPGTGKTTTLIRRLGQKIDLDDVEALLPSERMIVDRASTETGTDHRVSWVMFSPTELLRQYVKEAFVLEGVPASNQNICTWDDYRDAIARDSLGLRRTSTGGGAFYKRDNEGHLDLPLVTDTAAAWFDDFDEFFRSDLYTELTGDAAWLSKHDDPALAQLGARLEGILRTAGPYRFVSSLPPALHRVMDDIHVQLERSRSEAQSIITRVLNRLIKEDQGFPAALKQEIERQLSAAEVDDGDDPDIDYDVLEDDEGSAPVGRSVSRDEVKRRYTQAVSALARARARRRKISEKGRSGQLLAWLGKQRVPDDKDLEALGDVTTIQTRLRRFASFNAVAIRAIASAYRKFRVQRSAEGHWYTGVPARSSDICWQELDLLVLTTLRTGGEILGAYRRIPGVELPESGVLGAITGLYRNQVLVDEATDFSLLQLACMYELSHPLTRSFFICGDLNQRLTGWGIKSNDEIDWIAKGIERRRITVSYRQTGRLVRLAKAVARLGGAKSDEIVLPDRVDIEGIAPVWKEQLASYDAKADWLAARIREIETIVGTVPTIAVLVNGEQEVEPLADALNQRLQEISLAAVACKDGKVVGNDRDVRVFNIRHIKGLEFEAVFFTGQDRTIEDHPDLFAKYLYVGATRAATYLGVTFDGECPASLTVLNEHFENSWN